MALSALCVAGSGVDAIVGIRRTGIRKVIYQVRQIKSIASVPLL